jgi:microcystin-dependent protein
MSCTNCFNGCTEIVSDKCVKYTGIDIPELGISSGDTLLAVESAIINFLVPTLTGVGIKPIISESVLCDTVSKYLPTCNQCSGFTLNEVLTAIIKAACDLQGQVDAIALAIEVINGEYTLGCITSVSPSSGTHSVLQAVIEKLCLVNSTLAGLIISLPTTYVSIANINSYIEAYLASSGETTNVSSKMVPYTAVEYYGPLTQFDVTGAGTGVWANIYLCNGNNGTPDKRGRVAVGTTSGMGGGTFDPAVDPAIAGNPAYSLGTTGGANTVVLSEGNMPNHNHNASNITTDPGHTHTILGITGGDNDDNNNTVRFAGGDKSQGETTFYFNNTEACQSAVTNVTINTTISYTGGGTAHANIQPVLACHYIMYIP